MSVGISLFSRAVASQVSSAPLSLTSVFGMGTGGPSVSSTPTCEVSLYIYLSPFGVNILGDSWGNRTPVAGVRGRSLNRLTNEPYCSGPTVSHQPLSLVHHQGLEPGTP